MTRGRHAGRKNKTVGETLSVGGSSHHLRGIWTGRGLRIFCRQMIITITTARGRLTRGEKRARGSVHQEKKQNQKKKKKKTHKKKGQKPKNTVKSDIGSFNLKNVDIEV